MLSVVLISPVLADTTTIAAADIVDAFGYIWASTTNYGDETYLLAQADDIRKAYMRFNLTGIRGNIDSVELYLFRQSPDQGVQLYFAPLSRAFVESEVTWLEASDGVDWTTAGGDYELCDEEWCDSLTDAGADDWSEDVYCSRGDGAGLTEMVQDWVDGNNYGMVIYTYYSANEYRISSTEHSTGDERPSLFIKYTTAESGESFRRRKIIIGHNGGK